MAQRFIPHSPSQGLLLPPYLDDLIDEKDLVRTVSELVDQLDAKKIEACFPGGGRPSYHPVMMLKVLVYAYLQQMFSCRQIAKALRENITFMWLSGMSRPDFNTVNRFRGEYLREVFEPVFAELVLWLLEQGYIRNQEYFLDGTQQEADANKHKIVWRKNVERYQRQVRERVGKILQEADALNEAEDELYEGKDLPERGEEAQWGSEDVEKMGKRIDAQIETIEEKTEKRKLRGLKKRLSQEQEKLENYEDQQQKLGDRNSYSKTDVDATAMRMKNDELRPGYNLQVGSENGFVTGMSVHQGPNDGRNLIEHLEERKALGLAVAEQVVADAGYGYEENYEYLKAEGVDAYVKYPGWFRERSGSKQNDFHISRFTYDAETDSWSCPAGQRLDYHETLTQQQSSGYIRHIRVYRTDGCENCPLREACTRSQSGRSVRMSRKLYRHQQLVRERLDSPEGRELRKRRGHEIETVFGALKRNQRFRRFQLRGKDKVTGEFALHLIGYNLKKLHRLSRN